MHGVRGRGGLKKVTLEEARPWLALRRDSDAGSAQFKPYAIRRWMALPNIDGEVSLPAADIEHARAVSVACDLQGIQDQPPPVFLRGISAGGVVKYGPVPVPVVHQGVLHAIG